MVEEKTIVKEREREDDGFYLDDDEEAEGAAKYLLFNLSGSIYGINITHVTGIEEMQKITYVPNMPLFMKGVINLRGKIIPVIDLRLRFGIEERAHDDRTCVIIVKMADKTVGFIVDTVAEVLDIPEKDITAAPEFNRSDKREQFILGLGRIGEEVKILLDANKIIREQELELITENK